MNLHKTASILAAALIGCSCAARKEGKPPGAVDDPAELSASFVGTPEVSGKTPSLEGFGRVFAKLLPKKTPPPPEASPVHWAGEIRMVNLAENFALIESKPGAAWVPGEKYQSIRDARETGVLRMTSMRNHPFVIADIVSGDPSPGDRIHLPRPIAPPSSTQNPPSRKPELFPKWLREILPSQRRNG